MHTGVRVSCCMSIVSTHNEWFFSQATARAMRFHLYEEEVCEYVQQEFALSKTSIFIWNQEVFESKDRFAKIRTGVIDKFKLLGRENVRYTAPLDACTRLLVNDTRIILTIVPSGPQRV